MKPRLLSILFVVAAFVLLTTRCGDDEGITYSLTDVSSRVTGFSKEKVGAGAELTVNGSQLQDVKRIFVGNEVVRASNFISQTESSITFNVPTAVSLGMNNVLLVFAGSARATTEIEVIPLQAVTSFTPFSAAGGEKVTLLGINLNLVTAIKLGDLDATIVSQTPTALQFTTPAGFNTTGKITMIGTAGNANSATDLIACTGPTVADCANGLNSNDGFELGTGDNFDNWTKQNGGGFMLATTAPGEVYRGSRAVKVTRDGSLNPADQWRIQLASEAKATTIGAGYTVYVWAKAVGTPGTMRVSTAPSALYTADQTIPTTWTRLAFQFTANVAATSVVLDMNGASVTTFFIDDVKLIKNP